MDRRNSGTTIYIYGMRSKFLLITLIMDCSIMLKSFSIFLIFFLSIFIIPCSSSSSSSSFTIIQNFCKSTPHPNSCFDSLKLSVSINITNPLNFLLQILQTALSEAGKLSNQFSSISGHSVFEKQRGTVADCQELQQITVNSVKKSLSLMKYSSPAESDHRKLDDARAFLSAALTNKATCLEALDSASGSSKPVLVNSMVSAYKHVTNALSVLSKPQPSSIINRRGRRLLRGPLTLAAPPNWLSKKDRHILQSSDDDDDGNSDDEYDPSQVLTVAADGTGNFTTVSDAINFAPNNSVDRILIYVKQGVYRENVEIQSWKTNLVLLGDGSDNTVITGNRSVGDGWTTFRSATFGKVLQINFHGCFLFIYLFLKKLKLF